MWSLLRLHDTFSLGNCRRCVLLLAALFFSGTSFVLMAAEFELNFANLHNPYFYDRPPGDTHVQGKNYVFAPPPHSIVGIEGDRVSIPFTIVSNQKHSVKIFARVFENGHELSKFNNSNVPAFALYQAVDNFVEGNSNGSCSCPAGLTLDLEGGRAICGPSGGAHEGVIPKGCPSSDEQLKIEGTLIRKAPFYVKDALIQVRDGALHTVNAGTELFVVELPITEKLPKGVLDFHIEVVASGDVKRTIQIPLRVLTLKLDNFPLIDVSYWSSEDPRDLVERPSGVPLNAHWGGEWWSEEHWAGIEHLASQLSKIGVTNTLVPLFVKNPLGINAAPLIPVKCIGDIVNGDSAGNGTEQTQVLSPLFNFEFDFSGFRRWVSIFTQAGFRNFEGAHLFANGGALPNFLECDVYKSADDNKPYKKRIRFLSRPKQDAAGLDYALEAYKTRFLPQFLQALSAELKTLGIENRYFQHVIDENSPTPASESAYGAGVRIVRAYLPNVKTIDAINQYNAPNYGGLIDVPVLHLLIVYDDQGRRRGIRGNVERSFPGRKYFYNTALRRGGPNRFIDTNPLESRVYGWLALELGYNGMLYWASNNYRYPKASDLGGVKRSPDWSPYKFSLGPMPNGSVSPGYGAGGNWILFPTENGLTDSLRARRLRDGLVDHWIYMSAYRRCQANGRACMDKLANIRSKILGDSGTIGDFSKNPEEYDQAREFLLDIIIK